jgi:hypothetical protein
MDLRQKRVPPLIAALADADATVRRADELVHFCGPPSIARLIRLSGRRGVPRLPKRAHPPGLARRVG